jgi:predicted nucleic acid-binding protein
MTNGYVIDANVAAKWFLPSKQEPFTAEAVELLESFSRDYIKLLVPDLFWPEIGNVFWKAIRTGRLARTSAEEALETLRAVFLPTAPCLPLLADALAIATAFGVTVYDSLYVALAAARNQVLVTADERLVNAVGQYFPVQWLGSIVLG